VGAEALDEAADKLLSQWQVDDESSAAEHIAHKAVNDNKDKLKEAISDPDAFMAKIKKMFTGESSGAILPTARMTDPDLTKPEVVMNGVATILAEGLPIARMKDKIAPSQALILEGAATVLSAGQPTARVTSVTDSPGKMLVRGATSILVGGKSASIPPPSAAAPPSPTSSPAPRSPSAPAAPGGSGKAGRVVTDKDKKGNDKKGYADIMHLPVEDPPDPHAPMADHPFRFVDPETDEWRAWDPDKGMSATPSETPGWPTLSNLEYPFSDKNLIVAEPGERGWFGQEYEPGNWYLLGGLIDLGSPVWPGAGSGGAWYIPDSIFGMDMSDYYVPHDWKSHPSAEHSSFLDIFTEWEIPTFLGGLSWNPITNALQVVYSSATTIVSITEWTTSRFKKKQK
jgi:uncharacterized Zn-binding protein involved in type VI secretion